VIRNGSIYIIDIDAGDNDGNVGTVLAQIDQKEKGGFLWPP